MTPESRDALLIVEGREAFWQNAGHDSVRDWIPEEPVMRMVLFLAMVANSVDLIATALGIHWFGNREGNPLLAPIAHHHWWLFVIVKGILIPLLIVRLYRYRTTTPALATSGMALVTVALTVAVGQWLGWIAGVIHVGWVAKF